MDPDGSSILSRILFLLILVLCNAFFAMSEIAIISLNDNKIRKMAQEGNKKAGIIARLTAEPSKFLATIQVGVTLSGFLASAVAADTFAEYVVRAFAHTAVSPATVRSVSIVVITILLSYITLVFGELVPKRIAMQNYEKISFAIAKIVNGVAIVTRPFVALLSLSTNFILRLVGIDPNAKPEEVTEEEIRMMIDVGGESGTIEQNEKDMLNNIFEFDDEEAVDMMTHRTEMTAVEVGTSLHEVVALVQESGHSRIPVYQEDLDSIVGILYVKDLLQLLADAPVAPFDLTAYTREPLYVPESTKASALLQEFQEKKIQIAVVVDEYGGTSGLVTMEDLLEGIVGNIQDEYDDEEEEIVADGDGRYLIDGLADLDDVLEFFGIDIEDADEYDTIGGYVVSQLGYLPAERENPSVTVGAVRFTIQEMDERRVERLVAEMIPQEADPALADLRLQET